MGFVRLFVCLFVRSHVCLFACSHACQCVKMSKVFQTAQRVHRPKAPNRYDKVRTVGPEGPHGPSRLPSSTFLRRCNFLGGRRPPRKLHLSKKEVAKKKKKKKKIYLNSAGVPTWVHSTLRQIQAK